MKHLIIVTALGLSFSLSTSAAEGSNAQQTKMGACNKEAGDKKGDERKAFIKTCLSAKPVNTQQAKMKACNADAKDKKGDDRKKFMSECLKG